MLAVICISTWIILTKLVLHASTQLIPEYFTPATSQFKEISRTYSNYQFKSSKSSWSPNLISNLNENLKIYEGCLIHLINYNGIDIRPVLHPLVLSRYDVIRNTYLVDGDFIQFRKYRLSYRTRFYKMEKVPKNKTDNIEWCKRNMYYMGCKDQLSYLFLSSKSKPWTCEAHLYLFPPNDPVFYHADQISKRISLLIPPSFKRLFWNMKETTGYEYSLDNFNILVTTRTRYDVLVTLNPKYDLVEYWQNSLIALIDKAWDVITASSNVLLILVVKTVMEGNMFNYNLKAHTLQIMFRNQKRFNIDISTASSSLMHKMSLDWNHPEDYAYMYTGTVQRVKSSYVLNGKSVPVFQNWKDLNHIFDLNEGSFDHSLFEMEFRLLGEIFRNVSFYLLGTYTCPEKRSHEVFCDDYMVPLLVLFPTGMYEESNFRLHEKNLRFVSCGPVNKENLSISRLFNIFDILIWVAVLLLLIILPIVLTVVYSIYNYNLKDMLANYSTHRVYRWIEVLTLSFASFTRALLEQGDPFPTNLSKISSVRWLIITFLFAVLNISSLFKQENITLLTLPRVAVPLDTFEQLELHKFKTYTRAVGRGGWVSMNMSEVPLGNTIAPLLKSTFLDFLYNFKMNVTHTSSMFVKSELFSYLFESMYAKNMSHGQINENFVSSSEYSTVLNSTELLPFWNDILFPKHGCSLFDVNRKCTNETCPCDVLSPCNNTALFLPELDATQKYHELKEKELSAFLSQEKISGGYYSVQLLRWVNPIILKRFTGLQASGLLGWWFKFIKEFVSRIKFKYFEAHVVSPLSLDGNILVIFYMLLILLSIAIIFFCCEHLTGLVLKLVVRVSYYLTEKIVIFSIYLKPCMSNILDMVRGSIHVESIRHFLVSNLIKKPQ